MQISCTTPQLFDLKQFLTHWVATRHYTVTGDSLGAGLWSVQTHPWQTDYSFHPNPLRLELCGFQEQCSNASPKAFSCSTGLQPGLQPSLRLWDILLALFGLDRHRACFSQNLKVVQSRLSRPVFPQTSPSGTENLCVVPVTAWAISWEVIFWHWQRPSLSAGIIWSQATVSPLWLVYISWAQETTDKESR